MTPTLEEQIHKIVLQVHEDAEWIGGADDFDPIERATKELTALVREREKAAVKDCVETEKDNQKHWDNIYRKEGD